MFGTRMLARATAGLRCPSRLFLRPTGDDGGVVTVAVQAIFLRLILKPRSVSQSRRFVPTKILSPHSVICPNINR